MKIGRLIANVNNKKNTYMNMLLKQLDLSHGQAIALMKIHKHQVIQQDVLTKHLLIDKSAVTRILKSLEDKELIVKKMSENNRRVFDIFLTQKGEKLYPEIKKIIDETTRTMLKGIDQKQQEQLFELLSKVKRNLER